MVKDRGRREIKTPARFAQADLIAHALNVGNKIDLDEPSTFEEACQREDKNLWLTAMEEEMQSLHKNQTWKLVDWPSNKKVIGCRWIFKKKPGIPGVEPPRYKARVVAKGFSQIEGVDYHEVFSPVVKHTSIRLLLAIVAMFNLELEQMDVKTAFLHGSLDEVIYMEQPPGFEQQGNSNKVCHLLKSLYGLKQSPRQWYRRFDDFMAMQGYSRSEFDSCVYFKRFEN